jgi:hypothetical protein
VNACSCKEAGSAASTTSKQCATPSASAKHAGAACTASDPVHCAQKRANLVAFRSCSGQNPQCSSGPSSPTAPAIPHGRDLAPSAPAT